MKEKKITIKATPQAQGRPRFCMRGNRPIAFNPHKDKKNWFRLQISQQFNSVLEFPIELDIVFYMPIPKSSSKKKKNDMSSGKTKHIKKPDIDNLVILTLNCMTGIVYRDDSQVYKIVADKRYDENPRTEIVVKWEELSHKKNTENGKP